MQLRIVIAALTVLGLTGPLCAAPPKPNVVLQLKPIDEWLGDLKYLIKELGPLGQKLAGEAGLAKPADADKLDIDKRFEEELAKLAGPDWRKIVDSTRPLGGYAIVKEKLEEGTYVGMIPVKDVQALVKALGNFGIKPEEKDGLFTIQLPIFGMTNLYARAANGYVYVGSSEESVAEANLPKPEDIFSAKETSSLVLRFRIDTIPEEEKKKLIAELEKGMQQGLPNESEEFNKLVKVFADSVLKVWRDGHEWTLGLDFDRKAHEVALVVEIVPNPDTELAKDYREDKPNVSRFAALSQGDAGYVGMTCGLPMWIMFGKDVKDFNKSAEEFQKKVAEGGIKIEKAKAERLLKILAAAAPTDDTDLAFVLYAGKEGKGTGLFALHIKDGAKAEAALADLLKELPAEARERVKVNAGKIGSLNVHRIDLGKDAPEDFQKSYGTTEIAAVIAPDALYMAMGVDAEGRIKAALATKPAPAPIFAVDTSLAIIRETMELAAKDDKARAESKKTLEFLGKFGDRLRLAHLTRTSGETMKYRFGVHLASIILIADFVSRVNSSPKPPPKSVPKPPPPPPPVKPPDSPKKGLLMLG